MIRPGGGGKGVQEFLIEGLDRGRRKKTGPIMKTIDGKVTI